MNVSLAAREAAREAARRTDGRFGVQALLESPCALEAIPVGAVDVDVFAEDDRVTIYMVETATELRGRGYAQAAVAGLVARWPDAVFETEYFENPTARRMWGRALAGSGRDAMALDATDEGHPRCEWCRVAVDEHGDDGGPFCVGCATRRAAHAAGKHASAVSDDGCWACDRVGGVPGTSRTATMDVLALSDVISGAAAQPRRLCDVSAADLEDFSRYRVDDIVESARVDGVRTPIEIHVSSDGEMTLRDGHHRWLAARELGLTSLPVTFHFAAAGADGEDEFPSDDCW